jgi:diguanylate cyclase (GGDEF)-like protein
LTTTENDRPVAGEGVRDPEFLEALVGIHQHLEFTDLLQELLERAIEWSGADCGFGLGPGAERTWIVPLASSVAPDDPRFRAFTRLDPASVKKWLNVGVQLFEGLGPFASTLVAWPSPPPAYTVAAPVVGTSGEWAGFLLLAGESAPDQQALDRVESLLGRARPAVAHALQVLTMRELIIKDDTAHCFNRRYFEEFLPEELSRASRFRAPLSLIFLDMDNLKQVNSTHGHAMGSCTLLEVSTRIRGKIRKFDRLFRFGGDEFCILLPETEWHGAMEVANRVSESVRSNPFLVKELGGEGIKMTASLGIASYPLHARNKQDLIQLADRAMQHIKATGKNSIGVAESIGEGT